MRVHFISIGGSVMHQLAIALHRKGYHVTGTDDEIFEPAKGNLAAEGLLPAAIGWDSSLITNDIDAIILGMHAKADNPELIKASEMGLNIYSFPEYIYHESRNKQRVVIGGSHGKTTTTSMVMHVLKKNQHAFDYLVGAKLDGFDQSVNITQAPVIVCEGDEYPASAIEKKPKFHFLFPHIAVITGIAWDHINVFPSFPFYLEQFIIFINKIEPGGILIYNETDAVLKKLVEENYRNDIRYQPYGIPEHQIENGQTRVGIDHVWGSLKVFGNHNLLNLFAAFYVSRELGISTEHFINAISSFTGASKRLELLAANTDTSVYRDFAHAPSKVKATIDAVKEQFPQRKLLTILELHTFSSLNEQFMGEYHGALDKADEAVVYYSKHALALKRMPELPADKVLAGFNKPGLLVITEKDALIQWMKSQQYAHANLVLMSSGNYDGIDMLTFAKQITA
ncbi:MAG: hypothetical protein RLZZ28_2138 [Bacteroidota bacterium]